MGWFLAWLMLSGNRRVTIETVTERRDREQQEAEMLAAAFPWIIVVAFAVGLMMFPALLQATGACEQPPGGLLTFHAITQLIAGC